MNAFDHPPALGAQHPWLDPFAPQDIFNPRPDQELGALGALGPSPQDFPFTDIGRQEYYAAVRAAGQQVEMMQHMHMDHMRAQAAARDELVQAAQETLNMNLLLLL
jgi:hypothetical protein